MKKLTKKKQEIVDKWIRKNGCSDFDFKNEQIIFHDGAGFCIEKEIKYLPRHRLKPIKEGPFKGGAIFTEIKGPKVRHEFYKSYYSFCDIDDTINRLRRMQKMLNSLGYETSSPWNRNKKVKGVGGQSPTVSLHKMKGGKKK